MTAIRSFTRKWKSVGQLSEAEEMIDRGVVLPWSDAKRLQKVLSEDDLLKMMNIAALRFCERSEQRLAQEILVETVVIMLASGQKQELLLRGFLETLIVQPDYEGASLKLVDIALASENVETDHDDIMSSMAVSMVCELGFGLREYARVEPGQKRQVEAVLSTISTYLLSVSNTNDSAIRLSLLNYFGLIEFEKSSFDGFNKIMSRFGYTVLEQLFALLFNRKTEGVALQYLLENTPFILLGDHHSQRIIHQTWKFYMLKHPDRFGLFIQMLGQRLVELQEEKKLELSIRVFSQHLAALMTIISEVNHRELGKEVLKAFALFRDQPSCCEIMAEMIGEDYLRPSFKDLIHSILNSEISNDEIEAMISKTVQNKRGRRPSFHKSEALLTVQQVHVLSLGQARPAAVSSSSRAS